MARVRRGIVRGMKKRGWLVSSALVLGTVMFLRGGCSATKAPDERLASQYSDMCKIARGGIHNPAAGVRKLGVYLVRNGGDMLANFWNTIALIERIEDDEKHDDRARLARERWDAENCMDDWQGFEDAIDDSPEAQEQIVVAMERVSRTLEILLGMGQTSRELATRLLPASDVFLRARPSPRAR